MTDEEKVKILERENMALRIELENSNSSKAEMLKNSLIRQVQDITVAKHKYEQELKEIEILKAELIKKIKE